MFLQIFFWKGKKHYSNISLQTLKQTTYEKHIHKGVTTFFNQF